MKTINILLAFIIFLNQFVSIFNLNQRNSNRQFNFNKQNSYLSNSDGYKNRYVFLSQIGDCGSPDCYQIELFLPEKLNNITSDFINAEITHKEVCLGQSRTEAINFQKVDSSENHFNYYSRELNIALIYFNETEQLGLILNLENKLFLDQIKTLIEEQLNGQNISEAIYLKDL